MGIYLLPGLKAVETSHWVIGVLVGSAVPDGSPQMRDALGACRVHHFYMLSDTYSNELRS